MTTLEAINDCVKHWRRMIKASKKLKGIPHKSKMWDAIREVWDGRDCSVCKIYQDLSSPKCKKNCPLIRIDKYCGDKNSPWDKVNSSRTWCMWRFHARWGVLRALRKARRLYK